MADVLTNLGATPTGTITAMADTFLEGAPNFWFGGVLKYAPDGDGFYWGLSGNAANPLYKIGCFTDFKMRDAVQMTEVRCDTVGVKATIQKRSYVEVQFTLVSLLPLSILKFIVSKGGTVTTNATEHSEKMGIGEINNEFITKAYFSRIYDPDNGDYVSFTGHRCQFVDMFEIAFNYGAPWQIGVRLRMHADTSLPTSQMFATVIRYDPSAL